MEVSIYLPDDIIPQGQAQWEDVPRHVLESLALAWYQSGELSEEQVRRLLGYATRLEVHAFLKEHDVPLRYTLEDLEKDREAHRRLGL
jgi:predicted HTH domain antitoxin